MVDNEMCFPETWEEFEKQYGFYDSKQAYMYGNTRLIPTFRVEQWLDYMESVKHSQQSKQNKMEQVALLFGKKLGEPFIVEWEGKKIRVMFDEDYLSVMNFGYGWHTVGDEILRKLITGKAVIVDEQKSSNNNNK